MNIQKLILAALLGISLVGCNIVFAEDIKSDEDKDMAARLFKSELAEILGILKYFRKWEENPSSIFEENVEFYPSITIHFKKGSKAGAQDAHRDLGFLLNRHLSGHNALAYEGLGILDEILDIIFNEETGITPNTLFPDGREERSLFFIAAAEAAILSKEDGKGSKILFEKLQQRGGDAEILCNSIFSDHLKKVSAIDEVKGLCDVFCKKTKYEQENNIEHKTCTKAKDILARLTKKTEEK